MADKPPPESVEDPVNGSVEASWSAMTFIFNFVNKLWEDDAEGPVPQSDELISHFPLSITR